MHTKKAARTLRQQAEDGLKARPVAKSQPLTRDEANRLICELQVHQIELELQNEELRRVQMELDAARERYFALYDLAPVGYCTINEQGLIMEANLHAAVLLGMTRNTLVQQPITRFILKEDHDIFSRHRQQLLTTGAPRTDEVRMVKGDGTVIRVYLLATSAHDGDGLPVCHLVLSDATDYTLTAQESQRNELRLQRLVDILQHPAETIQEFLDYALDQAVHLTASKIGYIYHYHEDRKEFVLNSWSKGVMAECAVSLQQTCYQLDKTGIWGEAVRQRRALIVNDYQAANPLKRGYPAGHVQLKKFMTIPIAKGDSIVGVVGLANKETDYDAIDILQVSLLMEAVWKVNDRKQVEAALQESNRRLILALNAAKAGIWEWDLKTNGNIWSEEVWALYGLAPHNCTPSYAAWVQTMHPDERDAVEAIIRTVVHAGEELNIEWRVNCPDGPERWLLSRGQPVRDEQGQVVGYRGIVVDISERKRSEQENAKLQTHLNQAQKMEAIGVLAGGIAHDFNNILSIILGYSEMAKDDAPPDSPLASNLDRVLSAAHRAKDLVKQILAFSRQAAVNRMPIKIQPLIKESLKMLRASIPTTILIKEEISPQCGAILADPTQVYQIIMNLCTNAFHAMEINGGVLSIRLTAATVDSYSPADGRHLTPGMYVELEVSDTGTGIGPDIIAKIFDPYFTTKEIGKGTGMGLSITAGIIKSYGGAITVDSTLGRGTTFHVYLPVVREEAEMPTDVQPTPKGTGRILFVDDEEILVEMGKGMLERMGYTVTAHKHSLEAWAAFMEAPDKFDLLITDLTMPGLTGLDLARRMLKIRPDLPIILCTGFSHMMNESTAKAVGIREFALKPITMATIGQLIKKVLGTDNLMSTAETRNQPLTNTCNRPEVTR
jgi:PAS domain S-box-containing protein